MSSFTKPLVVKKRADGLWETTKAFTYRVGDEHSDDKIRVPAGFKTDFASVPRIFWMIIPRDGRYTAAAVLHDYMYHTQTRSRDVADKIFLEAMGVLGVPWLRKRLMYRAVRVGGWIGWNRRARAMENS